MPAILLVDDEAGVLSALRRALRREGWDVHLAEGAAQALRVLETERVDAVLSDYRMPGRNGLDLLAEVARRWPHVARFLITGWHEDASAEALAAAGVRAVFSKPWDVAELRATLREGVASA